MDAHARRPPAALVCCAVRLEPGPEATAGVPVMIEWMLAAAAWAAASADGGAGTTCVVMEC
jgi:hypothetical protein